MFVKCILIEKINCDINCFSCLNLLGFRLKELLIKIFMFRFFFLIFFVGVGGIIWVEGVIVFCFVVGSLFLVVGMLRGILLIIFREFIVVFFGKLLNKYILFL